MIALVQMVSIFGFGLGVLVARCSVNRENLAPQPMLMAMIAVTRLYGRVTFPARAAKKARMPCASAASISSMYRW